MKKIEKDLYIKHAKRLEAILNDQSSFLKFLTRADFNNVIKTELNVLFACEKLFPKVELESKFIAKSLVKQFNKLTKASFKIDEGFKYGDETDLIDSINYLVTFCKNMFSVNLDDLLEGKKVTATDPKIDLRAKDMSDDGGSRMSPNFAFAAGIPLAATPYENPYLLGKASAKLSDDMMSGKFYRYKTKPKAIPLLKWFACILVMLIMLGLILSGIFAFISTGIQARNSDGQGVAISFTMNGVFYIVAALFGIYPLYMTMKTLVGKHSKNENFKYYFNWGFVLMFLILALLFCLMDTIQLWMMEIVSSTPAQQAAFLGLKICLIIGLSCIGLTIIPLVLGGLNNPKPDHQAIENKMKEYIDMFSSQSGASPVPPKADVQKPTEVKESKKDSKSKKEDKK